MKAWNDHYIRWTLVRSGLPPNSLQYDQDRLHGPMSPPWTDCRLMMQMSKRMFTRKLMATVDAQH